LTLSLILRLYSLGLLDLLYQPYLTCFTPPSWKPPLSLIFLIQLLIVLDLGTCFGALTAQLA
jgi:hypothetical protein